MRRGTRATSRGERDGDEPEAHKNVSLLRLRDTCPAEQRKQTRKETENSAKWCSLILEKAAKDTQQTSSKARGTAAPLDDESLRRVDRTTDVWTQT